MYLAGKLVSELEINAPAEKYYKIFKDTAFRVPVHEEDNHRHGFIKIWNYTVEGKAEVFKERVEFDDEKLVVTLTGLEGDVFNYYKTFNGTYQIVPKGPTHCLAVLTLEYEKLGEDSPYPYKYLHLMNGVTKDIEARLK